MRDAKLAEFATVNMQLDWLAAKLREQTHPHIM